MKSERREEQTRVGLMARRNVLYCRNPNTDPKLVLLMPLLEFVCLILVNNINIILQQSRLYNLVLFIKIMKV